MEGKKEVETIAATTIDPSHPMLDFKVIPTVLSCLRFAATLTGTDSQSLVAATFPSQRPRSSRRVWHRHHGAVVNNSVGTHRRALGDKSNSSMKV